MIKVVGVWVAYWTDKVEKARRGDDEMKCKYLGTDDYRVITFCDNPKVTKTGMCPFGDEVECQIDIHLKNIKKRSEAGA